MFCSHCGTDNPNSAVFCAKCGASMPAAAKPEGERKTVRPRAERKTTAPEVKKQRPVSKEQRPRMTFIPILACSVVAIVVISYLIAMLCSSHGFHTAEDAALAWVEGRFDYDSDDMLRALYPEMADTLMDELEKEIAELEKLTDSITCDNLKTEELSSEEDDTLERYEQWFCGAYGVEAEFTDMKMIQVTYTIEANGRKEKQSETTTVFKISGKWYVWPASYLEADLTLPITK